MKRIAIITSVTLVSFTIIIVLVIQFGARPYLKSQLDSYLAANRSELYDYSYESLGLNPFGGILSIKNLRITPSPIAFDSLSAGKYEDIDQLYTREFQLDFDLLSYVLSRKVILNSIRILQPEISIYYYPKDTGDENEPARKRDPVVAQELFSDEFRSFQLDEFTIEKASFLMQNILNEEPDFQFDSVDVSFSRALISPGTIENEPLGLIFESFSLSTGDIHLDLNEYYTLSTRKILLNISGLPSDSTQKIIDLHLSNVLYNPKPNAMALLENNGIRALTSIASKEIQLGGFNINNLLVDKRLRLSEIRISNPEIKQYVNSKMTKETRRSTENLQLENVIEEIRVDQMQLSGGSLTMVDVHKSVADLHVEGVVVDLKDVYFSEKTQKEASFGIEFSQGMIHFDKTQSDLGKYYSLATGNVDFDIVQGDLLISDFALDPKQTPEEFSEIAPYETDHFDIQARKIEFLGIDMSALAGDLAINIESARVLQLNMEVYRNKWLPDPEFKYKPLPPRTIRELKIPFWIDTLYVQESNIRYRQLGDIIEYEDEAPGEITFGNLNVSAYNVTNDRTYLETHPELVVDAQGLFMNKHLMEAQYRLVIPDTLDTFHVTGHLQSVPTLALDPILKPLILIEIPGGVIKDFKINMTGTDDVMTGTIEMEYENLYIDILKAKNPGKSSAVLNTLSNNVIRHNNLRTRGAFVTGLVNAERKKNKSIFNYTWNGIKTGIISTVVPFAKKAGKERARKAQKAGNE